MRWSRSGRRGFLARLPQRLDAAHERGLVHRDMKPANMLLTDEAGRGEHVYLSDFGLARPSGAREPGDTDETIALESSRSLGPCLESCRGVCSRLIRARPDWGRRYDDLAGAVERLQARSKAGYMPSMVPPAGAYAYLVRAGVHGGLTR